VWESWSSLERRAAEYPSLDFRITVQCEGESRWLPERSAPCIPVECSLSDGMHFLLLPFSPYFTNLAFGLYYHKIPNGIIPIILIY
jgi:hypothetical protein